MNAVKTTLPIFLFFIIQTFTIIPSRLMKACQGEKELPERERGPRSNTWAEAIIQGKELLKKYLEI